MSRDNPIQCDRMQALRRDREWEVDERGYRNDSSVDICLAPLGLGVGFAVTQAVGLGWLVEGH
jgi:hypothetical protein